MITREEALKILKCRDMHGVPCGYAGGVAEAVDVAIKCIDTVERLEKALPKFLTSEFEAYAYGLILGTKEEGEW